MEETATSGIFYFLSLCLLCILGIRPKIEPVATICKKCIRLGVDYLGTEIDPQYIKTANENIEIRKSKAIMDGWLNTRILFE